jgi:circadian clock protein KaiC
MGGFEASGGVEKLRTGIEGFDLISYGGLPLGRTTLISGTAGSAKTVFAAQFLAAGIERAGEPGVFVTFEERADDIRRNLVGFGWDVAKWEEEKKWAFVDASIQPGEPTVVTGDFDLGALIARIGHAIERLGARRVSLDSLGGIFTQFDPSRIRHEIFRLTAALKERGVTAALTAERREEEGDVARYGVEEFVADNVIVLRNSLEQEKRRRTVEILKFRGTSHQKGQFPFTITGGQGIIVLPLSAIELRQRSSNVRISSGIAELDVMCGGGFFRDSVILVSGATGTGKTLLTTEFLSGGAEAGERSLLFAFEESHDQLFRNALSWGVDFEAMEADGRLRLVCVYPEATTLEDHLITMKKEIEAFNPHRVAVDSLSALERVSSIKSYREFVISLTSFIKHRELAGLFTATTPELMGGTSVSEAHISSITDSIILLRYVEIFGEMRRGVTVLKMRGSMHQKDIREFTIDNTGMHIGPAFRGVSGILSGRAVHAASDELSRLDEMFQDRRPGGHPVG